MCFLNSHIFFKDDCVENNSDRWLGGVRMKWMDGLESIILEK